MIKDAWTRRGAAPGPNNDDIDLSGFAINSFGNQQLSQVIFGTWGIVPSRDQAELKFDSFEPPYLEIGGGRTRGAFMGQGGTFRPGEQHQSGCRDTRRMVCEAELSGVDGQSRRRHSGAYSFAACFRPPEDDPRPANQLSFARSAAYATPFWPHPAYRNFTGALNTHLRPHFREEDNLTSEEAVDNSFAALEQAIADWKAENA